MSLDAETLSDLLTKHQIATLYERAAQTLGRDLAIHLDLSTQEARALTRQDMQEELRQEFPDCAAHLETKGQACLSNEGLAGFWWIITHEHDCGAAIIVHCAPLYVGSSRLN